MAVLLYWSSAVTVMLNEEAAVTVLGVLTTR